MKISKKIFLVLGLFFLIQITYAQQINLYLLPGQGSDHRIFDSLVFDIKYNIHYLDYGTPKKNQTMASFALDLSKKIDTTQKFVLIGVSLGGMICSELNEILSPDKVILISSAKTKNELPSKYRVQKLIPIYKMIPGRFLLWSAKILQPIIEPDRNKNKEIFKQMLTDKNPIYIKRTVNMIINWKKNTISKSNIIHIHGSNDHTIPIKNVLANIIIENGSHMMVLTDHHKIQNVLNKIL